MEKEKIRILYVDDEPNNLTAFKANFRKLYEIYTAESAAEGKIILNEKDIQVIITDHRMPNMTGVEFLESILHEHPDPVRMLLTGYADIEAVIDAINKGQVYRYIMKPWNEVELREMIESAYAIYVFKQQNKVLLKKYTKIFEESGDAIFVADEKGRIVDFNKKLIELFGFSRTQLNSTDYLELFDQDTKAILVRELVKNGVIKDLEVKLKNKMGEKSDCWVSLINIQNERGDIIGYQGSIKDVTTQKGATNELLKAIVNSQEEERDKIARGLHDDVAQQLAGIKFYIQTLQNTAKLPGEQLSEKLAASSDALNTVLLEMRKICFDLMPRTLVDFGLVGSVRDLCRRVGAEHPISFEIKADERFPVLDKNLEISIFRIIQEFITNSLKHGKGDKITIQIENQDNIITLLLKDNGVGFDTTDLRKINSMGHTIVRSRVEPYQGEVKIESAVGKGTSYKIIVPLQKIN